MFLLQKIFNPGAEVKSGEPLKVEPGEGIVLHLSQVITMSVGFNLFDELVICCIYPMYCEMFLSYAGLSR